MISIEIKNGCIIYYGNPAGYVKDNLATVDTMFKSKEFETWLSVKNLNATWTEGVFEKFLNGGKNIMENIEFKPLKNCRIWQLKSDSEFGMRFISYDEMKKNFGEPKVANYDVVFDGEIETNNLEEIYTKFNTEHPLGFKGHSLSISDVVELYDTVNSEFHYVDQFGFKDIEFKKNAQEHGMTMKM